MINSWEVQETNEMIEKENLDVRTITLGISLLDCIDSDLDRLNQNIYNKITTVAKDLVATGEKIEKSYTKEERKKFILSNLLTSSEPIKSYYFYKTLKISEGTLNNDFIEIEEWLDNFSIKLIRKPGTGIYVEGSEKDMRSAQVRLIYNSFEEQELIDIVKNVGNNIQKHNVIEISSENRLLNLIDKSIIKKVENSLSETII